MTAADLVNAYLAAFYTGDFEAARSCLDKGFCFSGPFVEARDRDAYLKSAAPLGRMVKGHKLVRQWVDGQQVASIYDVRLETPASGGTVAMFEWDTASGGVLVTSRVLFDSAAFRALVPAARP